MLVLALLLAGCGSSSPEKPAAQTSLETKLKEILAVYKQGGTQAQSDENHKKAVEMRDALFTELAGKPSFDGWLCKVSDVEKLSLSKQNELGLEVDCGFFTLYNARGLTLSKPEDNPQAIPTGHPLHDVLMRLNKNDMVKVSGAFKIFQGKIRESSLTTSGGMVKPELEASFNAVEPVKN